jgi:hypothetical protein
MSIQKIDNDTKFNEIKTGLRTEQELKDAASKIIYSNYLFFKKSLNIDNNGELEWIREHKQSIIELANTGKEASRRVRLEALANILLFINKTKYKQLAKSLFLKGKEIQKNIDEEKGEQEYNVNELNAMIDFDDLVHLREHYKDLEGYKNEMIYLILCLNTYMPPLRLEYLHNNERDAIKFGNTDLNRNFITENMDGKDDMELHIGNDKVVSKVGPVDLLFCDYKSRNGSVFIKGNIVRDVIRKSYWKTPREYVITSIGNPTKPMSVTSYYRLLKEVVGGTTNQNAIRKSYINYWYNQDKKLTLNDKKIISKYMRNSPAVAESNYKKVEG